jgi:hypothetical protein
MGFDVSAVPVAAGATVLPFVAVSLLTNRQAGAAAFLCPLLLGGIALGTLVIRQYHKREALMPVQLISHTLPVTGIGLACAAGAGFTALVQLATSYLLEVRHTAPGVVGGVLLTQVVGVAIAAVLVKRLFSTLWLPVPAFGGMSAVVAAGLVLLRLGHGGALPTVAVAGLLLGFGAGAGVSPGLFLAGLSVAANKLGPTFALVELLRAEAAFLVGPVVLNAVGTGAALREGVHEGALIVMVGGAVVSLVMLLVMSAARAQPQAPDLESWLAGERPAYRSPAFAAALREV